MIRVKDLKNQTSERGPHPILLCRMCGGEYSANAGDYFLLPAQQIMKCCGKVLVRVFKSICYQAA